eukprot:TRINITY_DN826_c0_g1_i1.p1 TRINITY_DN826_c0_g1~~TRINITY_DN826_c0_g1_i1.p1  ORF type:complete len:230 (+),score=76.82 TRINITY_DN826_c0_g1_i1:580-1269(+)
MENSLFIVLSKIKSEKNEICKNKDREGAYSLLCRVAAEHFLVYVVNCFNEIFHSPKSLINISSLSSILSSMYHQGGDSLVLADDSFDYFLMMSELKAKTEAAAITPESGSGSAESGGDVKVVENEGEVKSPEANGEGKDVEKEDEKEKEKEKVDSQPSLGVDMTDNHSQINGNTQEVSGMSDVNQPNGYTDTSSGVGVNPEVKVHETGPLQENLDKDFSQESPNKIVTI